MMYIAIALFYPNCISKCQVWYPFISFSAVQVSVMVLNVLMNVIVSVDNMSSIVTVFVDDF